MTKGNHDNVGTSRITTLYRVGGGEIAYRDKKHGVPRVLATIVTTCDFDKPPLNNTHSQNGFLQISPLGLNRVDTVYFLFE